jgi:hypothetical protein
VTLICSRRGWSGPFERRRWWKKSDAADSTLHICSVSSKSMESPACRRHSPALRDTVSESSKVEPALVHEPLATTNSQRPSHLSSTRSQSARRLPEPPNLRGRNRGQLSRVLRVEDMMTELPLMLTPERVFKCASPSSGSRLKPRVCRVVVRATSALTSRPCITGDCVRSHRSKTASSVMP